MNKEGEEEAGKFLIIPGRVARIEAKFRESLSWKIVSFRDCEGKSLAKF